MHPTGLPRRAILLQHGIMNHIHRYERTGGRDRRARRVGRNVWWRLCTDGHDVWGAQPAIDMLLSLRLAMVVMAMAVQVMLQAIEIGFVDKTCANSAREVNLSAALAQSLMLNWSDTRRALSPEAAL